MPRNAQAIRFSMNFATDTFVVRSGEAGLVTVRKISLGLIGPPFSGRVAILSMSTIWRGRVENTLARITGVADSADSPSWRLGFGILTKLGDLSCRLCHPDVCVLIGNNNCFCASTSRR